MGDRESGLGDMYSDRIGSDADLEQQDQNTDDDPEPETEEETSDPDRLVSVDNIREEWHPINIFLPRDESGNEALLYNRLDKQYKRLQYECDWEVVKTRHYIPLVIEHGLAAVEEMDPDEVRERVEAMNL